MYPLSHKSTEPGVHSSVPDSVVLPRLAHSQALVPGWDGKSPWAAGGLILLCTSFSFCDNHRSPGLDKPHSVSPCAGLQGHQSELPRGLNERQLEKKRRFITSTGPPSLEPICCQAGWWQEQHGEQMRLDGGQIRLVCSARHRFAC